MQKWTRFVRLQKWHKSWRLAHDDAAMHIEISQKIGLGRLNKAQDIELLRGSSRFKLLCAFQSSPYLLRRDRNFVHIHADRVEYGIADRRCDPVHGYFGNGFDTERMTRLECLHEDGFKHRHLVGAEDVITVEVALDGLPLRIVAHLFANRVTQCLGHPAFDLA